MESTKYHHQPAVLSASPHLSSPGDGQSNDGTPDTTLTAFSPEDVRRGSVASSSGGVTLKAGSHDPFVTPSSSNKLSAQTPAFKPANLVGHVGSSGLAPNKTQFGTFTTDTGASRCLKVTSIYDADVLALVNMTLANLKADGVILKDQRLESIGKFVYLRYPNIDHACKCYTAIRTENPNLAIEYLNPSAWASIASPDGHYSAHEGQVVVNVLYPANAAYDKRAFEQNLRDLLAAPEDLLAWQKLAATEAGTFKMVAEFYNADKAIEAVARLNGMVIRVGKVFVQPPYPSQKIELNQTVTISVQLHQPDLSTPNSRRVAAPEATPTRPQQNNIEDAFGRMNFVPQTISPPAFAMGPSSVAATSPLGMGQFGMPFGSAGNKTGQGYQTYGFPSVTGGSTFPYAMIPYDPLQGYGYDPRSMVSMYNGSMTPPRNLTLTQPSSRRQNAIKIPHRGRNSNTAASSHHNHVDIAKIRQGSDVRTTVMLRNIPNKLSQAQLKEIIDLSSLHRYDFMYLRIDFSNDCNVGYAFINFTDPLDIIDFVAARSNQRWYKSDKVAEVSYATIQGKDCLVQKFRNSSVMLEPPHYRPKLYYTVHDGPLAGNEEPFPESDNASKLKRSCENAEHVGLFAPSAGQHMRDEQRRRRSQYDRGTSLAEREEYEYDDSYAAFGGYSQY